MNDQLSFTELLGSLEQDADGNHHLTISDNWLQGRTTYGGLSAAICLQAVTVSHPDLPPLRSAQINFVGPVVDDISVTVKVMRQGRSVSYISAEMFGQQGLVTQAVFCFGLSRESRLNKQFTDKPEVPSAEDSSHFFNSKMQPAFAKHYNCKLAKGGHPMTGSTESEHYIWVQHKDKNATDMVALLGIADMPPPAVMPMFEEFAPLSSMTWMLNFLTEDTSTDDGWWLMRSAAEHAVDGYSSQDMQVWNSNGDLVVSALQNVAIFY